MKEVKDPDNVAANREPGLIKVKTFFVLDLAVVDMNAEAPFGLACEVIFKKPASSLDELIERGAR
jgi:hypothetical protein